eukprot:Hpha_TRINITY_DN13406_c1_g1::TRINITY_DN13406_c1_g1_i1::g.130944::m.130944
MSEFPANSAQSRKPADTAWKQQRLKAWQPIFSPNWVTACFIVVAAAFIPIGSLVIVASDEVRELELRYDNAPGVKDCHWSRGAGDFDATCINSTDMDASKCGMVASLPADCPRDYSKAFDQLNYTIDQIDAINAINADGSRKCDPKCEAELTFEVTETLEAPVYMYYKLTNFYQNHRRYAKSRNDAQLAGEQTSGSATSECQPLASPGEIGDDLFCNDNFNGKCGSVPIGKCNSLVNDQVCSQFERTGTIGDLVYSSCGLVAWSYFNDSFTLQSCTNDSTNAVCNTICVGEGFDAMNEPLPGVTQQCEKKGIAWVADRDVKFKAPHLSDEQFTYKGWKNGALSGCKGKATCDAWVEQKPVQAYLQNGWYMLEPYHKIPNPEDEDLMVWMRTASLPTFRKLYRKITTDIPPGSYRLKVDHRYDVTKFKGEKYIIITTLSWVGGKNYFLGAAYLAVGSICFVLAVAFLLRRVLCPTAGGGNFRLN